ncbi:hypothetical protein [Conexibacter sp. CPCC 206217]|uniref:hypothetical protein n=1 Tax=Conexibacter sp. CPCC 206217 TaxID=3064574 RepID=UPI0027211160|nr:hypothetical protein [Conexibacter sp. CPCC 206217]MDO8214092.1 hypothetical protein [Conexibacter sp. CPCC 206217]
MSRVRRPSPLAVELLLLAVGSAALAVLMHWPLVLHLGGDVAKDLGDPLSQSWQVAWGGHALLHQPLHLFDANQFYPYRDTLAFSDALIGYAPAGVIGRGPHAAIARYDVLYLFAYALAFSGAYLLARTLGAPPAAALVAGAAFAFSPWRLEQAGHLHVISSGGIPLALALFVRGWRRDAPWTLLLGWIVATWQLSLGWTLGLQLAYLLLALGLVLLTRRWWLRRGAGAAARGAGGGASGGAGGGATVPGDPSAASDRHADAAAADGGRGTAASPLPRPLLAATAAGGLLFLVVGVAIGRIYLRVADAFPSARRGPEIVAAYSDGPLQFLAAGRDSFVWADATAPVRDRFDAVAEQSLFPGLVVVVLAVLGAGWGSWPRPLRRGLGIGVLVTAVLALGYSDPDVRFLFPYGWLSALPGWDAIRTPGRLMTLTTLALALLAAAGAQRLQGRWRWAPLLLTALVLLEGSAFSLDGGRLSGPPHPTVPRPPAGLAAATPPLLELPIEADDNRRYLLWSTDGFPLMVNGRSSTNPPAFLGLRTRIAGFPDAASVARLQALGVRTVVLHRDRLAGSPWAAWAQRPWRTLGISRELRDGVVLFRVPALRP